MRVGGGSDVSGLKSLQGIVLWLWRMVCVEIGGRVICERGDGYGGGSVAVHGSVGVDIRGE